MGDSNVPKIIRSRLFDECPTLQMIVESRFGEQVMYHGGEVGWKSGKGHLRNGMTSERGAFPIPEWVMPFKSRRLENFSFRESV